MNRLKKWTLITIICGTLCGFTQTVNAKEVCSPRIAGILSTNSTYWQEMVQGIEEGCREQGLSFFVLDISLQDKDAMTWNVQDAWRLVLMSDVDVIIADGNLPDTEVIKEAREKGIWIVLVDSDAGKELRDAFVGTDNVQAGYLAAQVLDELYGISNNPVMIQDNETNSAVSDRFCGICEALRQKWPDVEIKSPETPWYSERVSNSSVENLILENPDIQAIFSFMESETMLYAQILKQINLEKKVYLIAFDRSEETLELLEDGVVDAVIVQESYEIGYQSAQIAGRLINGEKMEQDTIYIDCSVISQRDLPLLNKEGKSNG